MEEEATEEEEQEEATERVARARRRDVDIVMLRAIERAGERLNGD